MLFRSWTRACLWAVAAESGDRILPAAEPHLNTHIHYAKETRAQPTVMIVAEYVCCIQNCVRNCLVVSKCDGDAADQPSSEVWESKSKTGCVRLSSERAWGRSVG